MILREYVKKLNTAIPIMQMQGKAVDFLERELKRIQAMGFNSETRINLHEWFINEAKNPILPLYLTEFEVFSLQNLGYIPVKSSDPELHQEMWSWYKDVRPERKNK